MPRDLNAEHLRILRAAAHGELWVNSQGYVIDGQERPQKREREQLRGWGLIELRGSYIHNRTEMLTVVLTAAGLAELFAVSGGENA